MGYRTLVGYERQGKLIHLFFILCAVIGGALATIILTTAGVLPSFKIFIPDKLPENRYLSLILEQREVLPLYIHFLLLTSLSYQLLRMSNFVWQNISLSGVNAEINKNFKFAQKMRELRNTPDEDELARYLYNLRKQLASGSGHAMSKLVSNARRRLSAVFEVVSSLSAENILLINDIASYADRIQIDYGYRFTRFLIKLAIFLGPIGTVLGLVILVFPIITGDLEVNVLTAHLRENFSIAGYSIAVGLTLYLLNVFSKHLDEGYLTHLDNFLVTEIIQKIPFKSSDSMVLLGTYLRTLRNFEKSVDEKLKKLNDRIDHLMKVRNKN
ncbi:MAG TPA: hypothetical protein ENG51_11705 [Deltaproteobacteria bacterium]|nr:hypothetical protein [Deltaproteobacteria bacterium]